MMNPYDDIINLLHHTSPSRPHMPTHDRAAQFSPFAALSGYGAAIIETGRLTDKKVELDEYSKVDLNEKLSIIQDQIDDQPEVLITYFQPDRTKSGGAYITATGCVKKIDAYERMLVMQDGTKIPIDDIFEIDSELFGTLGHQKYPE
ncbi:MAG: YolD-like family protein [Saccharofermentanales bacterium]